MMLVVLVVIGGGCSITSTSGPEVGEVRRGGHPDPADPERLPYAFMRMTPEVVDILATWAPTIVHSFADRRPAKEITFGIGDAISVTIFEAAAGGLFIPIEAVVRPGNFVTLPNQNVDTSGNISVPYAGLVPALGKMPSQVDDHRRPNQEPRDRAAGGGRAGQPEHIADQRARRGEYSWPVSDGDRG
jgi:polysaccharide export outer membrane protein